MEHPDSFEAIYHRHKGLVYNLALNYLQNTEDAEEVAQDVFLKVHQLYRNFKGEADIRTWIYRITVNQCLDVIRHKKSKKRRFIFGKKNEPGYEYENLPSFEHPGVELENKESAAILFAAINTLPENQKTAFILSKIDGLSNPEIAQVMQNSIGAVESLLVRAKKALQEKLSDKFEEYRRKK